MAGLARAVLVAILLAGCAAPQERATEEQDDANDAGGVTDVDAGEADDDANDDVGDVDDAEAGDTADDAGADDADDAPPEQPPEEAAYDPAWQPRIDAVFANETCPAPRAFGAGRYTGPLIDSHIHIASIPDSHPSRPADEGTVAERGVIGGVDVTLADVVCALDHSGAESAFTFFPVYEEIAPQHVEITRRAMETYPDRLIPFIMPPANDGSPEGSSTVSADVLDRMLDLEPGLFEGYGEIGLYARQGGAPELPPDAPRLQAIYPVIREHDLVVYFHLGEGHQEAYERALAANRDIEFVFHGDQLVTYDENGQDLSAIEEILTNNPNVHYSVDELYGDTWLLRPGASKEDFLAHFADYEPLLEKDLATWKGIIERHPDRFMWSTDRGVGVEWSLDPDVAWTLSDYGRAFIARLDPAVQDRFAHQNARDLFGR